MSSIPLAAFRGNRFNIIFYDAAGVFFLRTQIEKYLLEHHSGPLNRLLQSILRDIRVPKYVAACKALSIIDKLVSGLFWRKLESSQLSILDMSEVYCRMKEKFDQWGEDASAVIDGDELLFPDFTSSDDPVAKELSKQSSHDSLAQEAFLNLSHPPHRD